MCSITQDIYDIGREEGKTEMIRNMLKYNQPVEMIARIAGCPVEKILEIAKSNGLTQ